MRIIVHLIPKASHNKIEGWAQNDKEQKVLRVKVTAIPEDGKANEALIKLISKSFHVAKSCISIVRGVTSRIKEVVIDGVEELKIKQPPP
jgi:uncharacterized protein (TIGR00251 family)